MENSYQTNHINDSKLYYLESNHSDQYIAAREMSCIILLIIGCDYATIGEWLRISVHAVEKYLRTVQMRLCCRNRRLLMIKILGSSLGSKLPKIYDEVFPRNGAKFSLVRKMLRHYLVHYRRLINSFDDQL